MKHLASIFLIPFVVFVCLIRTSEAEQKSVFENFVTASGHKLMDGDKEIRFISFNIPTLHYHEDYRVFRYQH